jgi:hypothetical protein
VRGDA